MDEDTVAAHENMFLPQDALQLLELYAGTIKYPNELRILPEPGGNLLIGVTTPENPFYLLELPALLPGART